jgi:prevent-host-death family protein
MDHRVSAAEANRSFSRILRDVREGHSYLVTSHGRPVARIVPAEASDEVAEAAWRNLLDRLERQGPLNKPRWRREDLYDDRG